MRDEFGYRTLGEGRRFSAHEPHQRGRSQARHEARTGLGKRPHGLLSADPRVKLDLDDQDLRKITDTTNQLLVRIDSLSTQLAETTKIGTIAFASAGVLALAVLWATRKKTKKG